MKKIQVILFILVLLSGACWLQLFFHYDERIHHHADEGTFITNWDKYEAVENWYLFSCAMTSAHLFVLVNLLWTSKQINK